VVPIFVFFELFVVESFLQNRATLYQEN